MPTSTFTDLDGDGLLDMIVGKEDGTLSHYEQATANSNSFTFVTAAFNTIDVGLLSAPTFTDLDGDGLLDMIVGKNDGTLSLYEQATANSTSFTLVSPAFNTIDVGTNSKPTFTDLDGDGLLDMIVGKQAGTLSHYEQAAVNGTSFTLVNPAFNTIDVGFTSDPTITDLDGDGKLDMIIGQFDGNSFHYEQITANSTTFSLVSAGFNSIYVNFAYNSTFTDIDGDGLLDMMIGRTDGSLERYEQRQSPIISNLSANAVCQGGTISISGTALYDASSWTHVTINGISAGNTTQSPTDITFTVPANATSGNVVVTTDFGTSNAVPLTINATPTASISGNTSLCIGGNTVLTSNATAGSGTISSYQWKVGGVNVASGGASATYTATAAGSYTVTVTNSNGCSFTSSAYMVSVNALPSPTITAAGATTFCSGGSVSLSASEQKSTLQFNGSTQSANLATLAVTTNTMTMEAWVYANGAQFTYTGLIMTRKDASYASGLNFSATNTLGYIWNGAYWGWTGGPQITPNTWFHVALVIEPTKATIYLNGVPTVNTGANPSVTFTDITQLCTDMGGRFFNGQMKEVRIWNAARTQAQIQAGMYGIVPTSSANLLAFYKLDEGSGTSVNDASAHYAAGSLVGAPSWVTATSPFTNSSFLWSPGSATTNSISATTAGNYTVAVTNANGCAKTAAATTVTVDPVVVLADNAQPNRLGNGLNFNGINNSVTATSTTLGNFGAGAFTVELWVKTPSTSNQNLINKRASCNNTSMWNIKLQGGVPLLEMIENTSGTNFFALYANKAINDGTWHHIACTRSASGGIAKIYIDGVLSSTATGAIANISTTASLQIGTSVCNASNDGTNYFRGTLDEIRLWTVERSAVQMAASMNTALIGTETGLGAYYDCNQGTSEGVNTAITTLTDKTVAANTATLVSFTKTGTTSNFVSGAGALSVCIGGSTAAFTNSQAGGTWAIVNGTGSATVSTAGVVTGVTAGIVKLTYSYNNACGNLVTSNSVTVSPNNTASAASSTPILCINTALSNITHSTTGATGIGTATGLPAGVTAAWAANTITISGTPTAAGTFNYAIPLSGGCGTVNATGTITVTANKTASVASSTPTLCINTPLTSITHTTTGATGIGTSTGLPAGVTATWANDTITISGTPTASGTFSYTIPLTGGCGSVNATGTITVTPAMTASAASSTPTLCINTPLTNITHSITGATGILSLNAASYSLPPAVTKPTLYEDLGKVTIMVNGSYTTIINNITPINSLSGTIGTASGINGSYSDFTAFGPYAMNPGSTYSFSLSSITTGTSQDNAMAIYIDYNRNGVFTDAGEQVYSASALTLGAHTETGIFTIPSSAFLGVTRMRVICNSQGLITSPTQTINSGEYEEYSIRMGVAANYGLPAGVTAAWANNTITISGTPTVLGAFNYAIPLAGGCGLVNATGTIMVPTNTAGAASSKPTLCINTPLSNITHTTTTTTGIGTATGLPGGVTAAWASNTITISGTPTASGTFNYSIPLTGGCGSANATGTITVTPALTASAASSTPSLCIHTALTNITHVASGIVSPNAASYSLPPAVTYNLSYEDLTNVTIIDNGNVVLNNTTPINSLSGTIGTASGTRGGYSDFTAFGPYNMYPGSTYFFSLSSGNSSNLYNNTMAIYIDYNRNGVFTDPGEQVYTSVPDILGNHTDYGTFMIPSWASLGVTRMRIICRMDGLGASPITSPTQEVHYGEYEEYSLNIGGIGASGYGLPAGVTAAWASNTITISGTPTASGNFNYSIPLTDGCAVYATGTITVTPAMTASAASSTPTLCINTPLTNITHSTTGATGILSLNAASYTLPPAVVYPTADEDLGNVTISLNGSVILNNTTPINSLSGTIGTASGTAGSYADFTAFGPYAMYPGSTYTFSLSSITTGTSYNNAMAIYIDYNRNGVFTDAGEQVYSASALTLGAHSETGTFTIPSSALLGVTRMRVICNEGLIISPTQNVSYGEYEEYSISMGYGLPAGVTAAWVNNTITISGTPTQSGTFSYTIPLTGGCGTIGATGTITVNTNTASAASSTPSLCTNTPLSNITHSTTGATGIGTATGLPAGVTASWASNTITISGTPTASGTFSYSIPLTGGCVNLNATGTITVNTNTASAASSTPSLCINAPLTNITHSTTGATGIGTIIGLPSGVTASWASNTITISGTPTQSGTFNYSIPLTGGCGSANATGTIMVNTNTASVASSAPTLCNNTPLNITHTTTGATGIGTAIGLPIGVTAAWFYNKITISGTPTQSGTFNYAIPSTGGCGPQGATGTIVVLVAPSVTIAANPGNSITTGTSVTFTATPTNGGATPAYQWKKNGNNVGTNSITYTDSAILNGDVITCALTNNSPCTVTSNSITMEESYPCPSSTTWTSQSTVQNNNTWNSVTYGNGLYVAVSGNGKVMTSPDAITWTPQTSALNNTWISVTYGNNLFVAVSYEGNIMTSGNGTLWTLQSPPVNPAVPTLTYYGTWYSVTYGNGKFVAVDIYGRTMNSPDGINWTVRGYTGGGDWTSVTYGNGKFVAVGERNAATSTNGGNSWENSTNAPPYDYWISVCYGKGLFVAVAAFGGVMTSPDGNTWTSQTPSPGYNEWYSVTYGNNLFVAVAYTGGLMTSPDGINWTGRTPAVNNSWSSVTYGNGVFVAVSLDGTNNRVMTSFPALVTPSVIIAANPGDSITTGTSVTYTATPTNGGFTPAYQWKKNGINVGNNSITYTDATLANGDIITCVLTSNNPCASTANANSNGIIMVVLSANANLNALSLSSGTLSPTFASATTSYTARVSSAISSITVTPTRSDANATIQLRVNGATYVTVSSGAASNALPLNVGNNYIDVRVTAQDGTTTKTYTITVSRCTSSSSITNASICPSQLPYSWNGSRSAAGNYTYTSTNSQGCDSVATLNLTIKAPTSSNDSITINSSQLPYSWNGLTFNAAGTQTANLTNAAGCDSAATLTLSVTSSTVAFHLKAMLQGLNIGNGKMIAAPFSADGVSPMSIADTITVELRENTTPFNVIHTINGILDTAGNATIAFPSSVNGNSYYVVVGHRNSLSAWSASPITFSATTNYDFTNAITKAYGSNMAEDGGVFMLFSGDINQDGSIDFNDYPDLDTSCINGDLGYLPYDLNGDASVDFNDYPFIDINCINGVILITP
jgi:hypothetical protein